MTGPPVDVAQRPGGRPRCPLQRARHGVLDRSLRRLVAEGLCLCRRRLLTQPEFHVLRYAVRLRIACVASRPVRRVGMHSHRPSDYWRVSRSMERRRHRRRRPVHHHSPLVVALHGLIVPRHSHRCANGRQTRRPGPEDRPPRAWWVAIVALCGSLAWIGVAAPETYSYVGPHVASGFTGLIQILLPPARQIARPGSRCSIERPCPLRRELRPVL